MTAIDEFFGEVIYAYADQMAIDDGVLVDISSTRLRLLHETRRSVLIICGANH
jgi:type I site-specific restriction endonuclease